MSDLEKALERASYDYPYVVHPITTHDIIHCSYWELLLKWFVFPEAADSESCKLARCMYDEVFKERRTEPAIHRRFADFCINYRIAIIPKRNYDSWAELNYPTLAILEPS